jgi:hypothetical protein
MGDVLAWKQITIEQLTSAQQKFWALLQDEQNRALTPLQIAQKAGYKRVSS